MIPCQTSSLLLFYPSAQVRRLAASSLFPPGNIVFSLLIIQGQTQREETGASD